MMMKKVKVKFKDKISPECGEVTKVGLDESERKLALDLHNKLRAKVARGEELKGDPGPQPSASNMMQMVWDKELELGAQTWAQQCISDHDCPNCRTVSRFKVGQNLYEFGHTSGSWKRSVQGWYDEVQDFNSSLVFPFYVIPGVLVGHYTQLVWAQTWRMGCGKIYFKPEGFQFGKQLFICNYGIAGNLIRSQMYIEGQPCSKCPPGTSCSQKYPGLCSGTPDKPLTVRPPVILPSDFPGFPTKKPGIQGQHQPTTLEVINTFVVEPPLAKIKNESCLNTCKQNGGCSVRIHSNALISGAISGSCFPPSFGGKCSGIPEKCKPCLNVCQKHPGKIVTIHLDQEGNPKPEMDIVPIKIQKKPPKEMVDEEEETKCVYNCQKSGGCSVRIRSNKPVSGNTLGSCFSPFFGGACSGIPERCDTCLVKCKGKSGQEFTLDANN